MSILTNFDVSRIFLRSRFFQLTWIVLFFIALLFYYGFHPPLRFIAHNLIPLVLAFLHVLALTGLGWPLMRILLRTQPKAIEGFASLAFGMGLTALFSFLNGLAGNFQPVLFAVWEVSGWILFVFAFVKWLPFEWSKPKWTIWDITGAIILTLFLVPLIPFVVAPEISTDAIAYHLLIPKLYLLQGKIYHLQFFVEAYYPSLAEYNYLPLLLLSNEFVCKSFHFWICIALLIFLSQFIRTISPGSGRILAPALFFSMPVTVIHAGWAWNDFMYTFFVLLSVYFLFCYHRGDKTSARDLLVAGILAGLASWTKYTFVLYFFATLLLFLVGIRRWKWNVKHLFFFFLGIGFVAPFWLMQNWMFTENPFYPFLNQIFQSPYWTENADRFFHNALRRWEIADWNWLTYLTFPYHVTMKARLVDIHTGLLPLLFIPLLFLRSAASGVRFLKVYIAACVLVWLFIHTENRSLFTVFAALFCVTAIALEELPWRSHKIRNAVVACIFIVTSTNFYFSTLTMYHLFDPFRYFFGMETAVQYRSRLSESQQAFDFLHKAPDAKVVLLVSIDVPYYLQRPFFFSSFSDPPIAEVLSAGARSAAEIEAKFRGLGITHIVLNRGTYQQENREKLYSWSDDQRKLFEEFLLKRCEPLVRYGADYVFRVKNN